MSLSQTLSELSPDLKNSAADRLNELLLENSKRAGELPPLSFSPPDNSWLKNILETISEWLKSRTPEASKESLEQAWKIFSDYWPLAIGILFGALLIFLAYRLIKTLRTHLGSEPSTESTSILQKTPEQLSALLETALREQKFSFAARIRWVLFLSKIDEQKNLTPIEVSKKRKDFAGAFAPTLESSYRLMFSGQNELALYQQLDVQLGQYENRHA